MKAVNFFTKNKYSTLYSSIVFIISIIVLIWAGIYLYQKKQEQKEISFIRAYYDQTNSLEKFIKFKDSLAENKASLDSELNFAHRAKSTLYQNNSFEEENFKNLESLAGSSEFNEAHPLIQFYILNDLSYAYIMTSNFDKSLNYYEKAYNFVENDTEKFDQEFNSLQNLMVHISSYYSDNNPTYIQYQEKELEEAIHKKDSFGAAIHSYNLAHSYNELNENEKALQKNTVAENQLKNYYNDHFIIDVLGQRTRILKGLDRKNEIPNVVSKIEDYYSKNLITERDRNLFYTYYYLNTYDYVTIPNLEQKTEQLIEYFPDSCSERIPLFFLHDLASKISLKNRDETQYIAHLEKVFHYASECGEMEKFMYNQSLNASDSILHYYNRKGDMQSELKWYKNIQDLESQDKANRASFAKMAQFLSNRELKFAEKDISFNERNLKNKNIILIIVLFFFLTLIISLFRILKLYHSNIEYQSLVEQKGVELKEKNKEIQQQNIQMEKLVNDLHESNISLQNFAKVAAHDIKSPLATIHQIIEYIEEKYKEQINHEDQGVLGYLQSSSLNLSHMIDSLLQYSTSSQNIIKKSPIDLNSLLNMIQIKLGKIFKEKNVTLYIEPQLPEVMGNKVLLRQLFTNLILSSLYSEHTEDEFQISVSYELGKDRVKIKVEDNGVGIKQEHLPHLFSIFKKSNETEEVNNSGILLATCKKIVENHEGEIWVESEKNKGTRYIVELPIANNKTELA